VLNSARDASGLRWIMTFAQRKLVVLSAWVATVAIVGMILAIDRPEMWMLVACFALIPAAIGHWFWDAPEATLSQLIAKARSKP
jgi:hypothetical protein